MQAKPLAYSVCGVLRVVCALAYSILIYVFCVYVCVCIHVYFVILVRIYLYNGICRVIYVAFNGEFVGLYPCFTCLVVND